MKKLIIYCQNYLNINFNNNFIKESKFDYIAVENGYFFLKEIGIKKFITVGDFDSCNRNNIKSPMIIKKEQLYSDLEYVIIKAQKKYKKIYCFSSGPRKDHSLTNLLLVLKYGIYLYEENSLIYKIIQNTHILKKNFKYISFYSFEEQFISCNGLKFSFKNKKISLKNTEFISNEIIKNGIDLKIEKELIIIQSN